MVEGNTALQTLAEERIMEASNNTEKPSRTKGVIGWLKTRDYVGALKLAVIAGVSAYVAGRLVK